MNKDIVPELLEKIQKEFKNKSEKSKVLKQKVLALKAGKATHLDSNEFAIEVGNILADVFKNEITENVLPDNRMYYNIAKRLIEPNMKNNFDIVSDYSRDIQEVLNKESNISLKAIKPEMNQDRIDGIVNKISEYEDFKEGKWLLEEPIKNFTQSVVDDTIKTNADFQYKAGLTPKIVRKEVGSCCDWCKEVVGVYEYPDVPKDVYRRHRFCKCTVDYLPGNGKKKDVWSKKWTDSDNEEVQERIKFSNKEKDNSKYPSSLGGVPRGNMMTFEEADGERPNPRYMEDQVYRINCQTCVVAYEARRRGYDVIAKGNFEGSLSEMLSRATNKAWIDPKTGLYPEYIRPGLDSSINTPTKYMEYLEKTLKNKTRYTMEFGWKGRGNSGHIVHIYNNDGEIVIYDPQTGKTEKNVTAYLKNIKFKTTVYGRKYTTAPKLLEVENYDFNLDIVNKILEKAGD